MLKNIALAAATLVAPIALAAPAAATPAQFEACLHHQGVHVKLPPTPPMQHQLQHRGKVPPTPPGVSQAKWTKAYNACKRYAPPPR